MTLKTAPAMTESPQKAAFSGAQAVGQGHEIPYGYRKPTLKDYADVIVATLCLAAMLGMAYLSTVDTTYRTAARISQAIERVFGRIASGGAVDTRKTILVVESDEEQRLIAKTALEHYGYDVTLADDGKQAAAAMRQAGGRVALVVVDTRNANLQTIRLMNQKRPAVPIVVSAPEGQKLQAGVSARIDQPFSALPLAETVQKILRSRAL